MCGSIVEAMAVVNTNASIAIGVFVCAGAIVNHNSFSVTTVRCNAEALFLQTCSFWRKQRSVTTWFILKGLTSRSKNASLPETTINLRMGCNELFNSSGSPGR